MIRRFPLSIRKKYNAYLSDESIFHIERIYKKIEEARQIMPTLNIEKLAEIPKGK